MSDPKDAVYVAPEGDLGEDATRDAGDDAPDVERPDAGPDGEDEEDAGGCSNDEECMVPADQNLEGFCQDGACAQRCQRGFTNLPGEPEGSCGCQIAQEICDNMDNDCDGLIDTEDEDLLFLPCKDQDQGACAGILRDQCVDGVEMGCDLAHYQSYNPLIVGEGRFDWSCDADLNCDGFAGEWCCRGDAAWEGVASLFEEQQQSPSLAVPPGALTGEVGAVGGLFVWEEAQEIQLRDNLTSLSTLRWAQGSPGAPAAASGRSYTNRVRYPSAVYLGGHYYIATLRPKPNNIDNEEMFLIPAAMDGDGAAEENLFIINRQDLGLRNLLHDFSIIPSPDGESALALWVRDMPAGQYGCSMIVNGSCVLSQLIQARAEGEVTADSFGAVVALNNTSGNSDGIGTDPHAGAFAPAGAWGEAGVLVAWYSPQAINPLDNDMAGSYELQWRVVGANGEATSTLHARVLAREEATLRPAVVAVEGGYWLLWIEPLGQSQQRRIFALRLSATGEPVGEPIAQSGANNRLRDLQAVALDNGAVALFWSEDDVLRWRWLHTGDGEEGAAFTLVEGLNPMSPLRAAALDGAGVAVMYVVQREVEMNAQFRWETQALNYEGEPLCLERLP